jgi:hypothetical protein
MSDLVHHVTDFGFFALIALYDRAAQQIRGWLIYVPRTCFRWHCHAWAFQLPGTAGECLMRPLEAP